MKFTWICSSLLAIETLAFHASRSSSRSSVTAPKAVATEVEVLSAIESPDFYWKYRLDRIVKLMNDNLPFNAANYPESVTPRALYEAYYLDLVLAGKTEEFDFEADQDLSDDEWIAIYDNICDWTVEVDAKQGGATSVPSNDFDLLKQYYPQLNFRDLEISFSEEEVGANFPYRNMKELLGAAAEGKLNVPGYNSLTTIDGSSARAKLNALKESSMKRLDDVYADSLAFASNSLPDETAKEHYKALREKLATFPQSPAAWAKYRADFDKEVDEMAALAGKKVDEHHHHHEGEEEHMSPAQEFELKYGRNLDEMQQRMDQYKSNPEGFLEASIVAKFGKAGLDVWKKSQEFSANMATLSEADKAKAEKAFAEFLSKA